MIRKGGLVVSDETGCNIIYIDSFINEHTGRSPKRDEKAVIYTYSYLKNKLLVLKTQEEMRDVVHDAIIKAVAQKSRITSETYLCTGYVASIIADFVRRTPEHLIAFRFFAEGVERNNPYTLKHGADVCFLICSVFPGRANWRLVNPKYYESMGIGLYFSFACQTNSHICHLMSKHFSIMVQAVKDGFSLL